MPLRGGPAGPFPEVSVYMGHTGQKNPLKMFRWAKSMFAGMLLKKKSTICS